MEDPEFVPSLAIGPMRNIFLSQEHPWRNGHGFRIVIFGEASPGVKAPGCVTLTDNRVSNPSTAIFALCATCASFLPPGRPGEPVQTREQLAIRLQGDVHRPRSTKLHFPDLHQSLTLVAG